MRYTDIDRKIDSKAAKQHGVISRQQAYRLGASERFVARRLRERHWTRVAPGVFVLTSSAATWLRTCKVAELSVPGAALAGESAAALHGLTGFGRGRPEIVVPINANCRSEVATCHRYAGAKLTTVAGFVATSVAQTLCDVSMRSSPWKVERALDDAVASKRVTIGELVERIEFSAGRRRDGIALIAPLVGERTADGWEPPATELEALAVAMLHLLPGAPVIVRQAALPWRSPVPGRVDFYLPEHRLIIEADGRRWHTRVADFDRDRWRDNQAVANGCRVQRFTWVHLREFPAESAALVGAALRAAA